MIEKRPTSEELQNTIEQLKADNTLLKHLAESIPDIFFAFDKKSHFIYWNKACENLTSILSGNAIGKTLYEIFPKTMEMERVEALCSRVIKNNIAESIISNITLNSNEHLFEISAYPAGSGISVYAKNIAEEKRSEEKSVQNETKYQKLVEITNTGFVIIDDTGRVIDANNEYVRLSGHNSIGQILGRNVSEWTAKHDHKRNMEEIKKCLKQGSVKNLEIEYVDKKGSYIPVEVNATTLNTGTDIIILTLCRDISERKQYADKLKESERTARSLLNSSEDIAILIDASDFSIIDINEVALNRLGKQASEFVGKNAFLVLPDNKNHSRQKKMKESVEKVLSIQFEDERNGRFYYNRYNPITDQKGKVTRFAVYSTDITARKLAEKELHFSEEKFSKAFMSIPEAFSIASVKTGKYIEVNEVFLNLTGFTRNEVIGHTSVELNVWICPDEREKYVNALMDHCPIRDYETNFRMKSSEIRKFLISSDTIDLNGELCSISFLQDITERRHFEESLKDSEERYRVFMNSTDDMAFLKDNQFRYLLVNQSNAAFIGKSEAEIIGKTDIELMPDDLAKQCSESDQMAMNSNEVMIKEEKTGDNFYEVHKFKVPLKGGMVGIGGYIRDITKHKKIEKELLEYSQRLKLATASGQLGVWDWNVVENIMIWDDRMFELYGIQKSIQPITVNAWIDGLHPEDRQRAITECNAALAGEKDFNTIFRVSASQWQGIAY